MRISLTRLGKYTSLFVILLLGFYQQLDAQYGWYFTYITTQNSHWAHLASGDTTAICRFTFSRDNPGDPKSYYLKKVGVRPLTNSTSEWFITELQLWQDGGNNRFDDSDSLISSGLNIDIPKQSEATRAVTFNLGDDSLLLQDNRTFFVVVLMPDWRDDDLVTPDIDTTDSGPQDLWFSLDILNDDITVSPAVSHDINPHDVVQFPFLANNLPVTVRNLSPSVPEAESAHRNMFFPRYNRLDHSTASQNQRITQLTFTADIFFPVAAVDSFKFKAARFTVGYDNRVLSLDTFELGEGWGTDAWFFVDDTLIRDGLTDQDNPHYSLIRLEAELDGSADNYTTYREIDSSSIARIQFRIVTPGVSPIFLMDIDVVDEYGVHYHPYQHMQNDAYPESGADTGIHDAWAKFLLGDYTYSGGTEISTEGQGDGRISWEDISLFSDYLWLNASHPNWYQRFDVGSRASRSPTGLNADDTTNFYDLMVLAANYLRTQQGAFNQKPVTETERDIELVCTSEKYGRGERALKIALQHVHELAAAHLKFHFDPLYTKITGIYEGRWLKNSDSRKLLIYPEKQLAKGTLDFNLALLERSLSGNGDLVEIRFTSSRESSAIRLEEIDLRNAALERITVNVDPSEQMGTVPTEHLLLSNFPNPFNAHTTVSYRIPAGSPGFYEVRILDLQGRIVDTLASAPHLAGDYTITWDGTSESGRPVASGIYILYLRSSQHSISQKIMLLR